MKMIVCIAVFVGMTGLACAQTPQMMDCQTNKNVDTGISPAPTPSAIPWSEVGVKAGADYRGDGLTVTRTTSVARLRCVFQRLDGEATRDGLWLTSTVTNQSSDRFCVLATSVGRDVTKALPASGEVTVAEKAVRFSRPGLVEEYSVSMDGMRQDFVVAESPAGAGELQVRLAVTGARVEQAASGATLVLEKSGRKIAYSRLRATDATGKELQARMLVAENNSLVVRVNDIKAMYPVRIDPTFSDANWISMGVVPGVDESVYAAAMDGAGNLYIGGAFVTAGGVPASRIAKWDGSSWSALGSGMNNEVWELAASGSDVYAGGLFTTAGGSVANYIAKWNGSSWSALGSGMNSTVYALTVSGSDVKIGRAHV